MTDLQFAGLEMAADANVFGSRLTTEANRRAAAAIVREVRTAIAPVHRGAVDGLSPRLRRMAGYHIGWWDADERPTEKLGKAFRPAFVLSAARAVGGPRTAEWDNVRRAAVAVELIHDFTLIHDDVMDGDKLRRGRPTTWAVFGSAQAILAGDALLTLAHGLLSDDPQCGAMTAVVAEGTLELYGGQSDDLAFERRMDVSPAQCLSMIEGKTGALLGMACELGALAAGAETDIARHYREFGRQLGLAFQLVDDLMGIWGPAAVTGKSQGSDLFARKKSFPVVAAINSHTAAGDQLAELYARPEPFSDKEIEEATRLVEAAGGLSLTRAEAETRARAALSALERAYPRADNAEPLRVLARSVLERDH